MAKKKYSQYSEREKQEARERWHRWAKKNRKHLCDYGRKYNLEHPEIHLKASRKYAAKHRKSRTKKELNKTSTWIGRRFELDALRILKGSVDLNSEKMNHPKYDLLWNGKRIDVKGKTLWYRKKRSNYLRKKWISYYPTGQWTFHSAKIQHIDFVLCLGYDRNERSLLRAFLIPASKYPKTGTTITRNTKRKFAYFEIEISGK